MVLENGNLFSRDLLDRLLYILLFYLSYSAIGAFLSFFPLFFKQAGLDAAQVGLITGIRPCLQILGSPVAGLLADKYKKRKLITIITLIAFVAKYVSILLVKLPDQTCIMSTTNSSYNISETQLTNRSNPSRVLNYQNLDVKRYNYQQVNRNLYQERVDQIENAFTRRIPRKDYPQRHLEDEHPELIFLQQETKNNGGFQEKFSKDTAHQNHSDGIILNDESQTKAYFIQMICIVIITDLFGGPCQSLLDTANVEYLEDKKHTYAHYRLWGSIGIALSALLTSYIIEANVYNYCNVRYKRFYVMFYIVIGFASVAFIPLIFSKEVYSEEKSDKTGHATKSKFKTIFCTVKNAAFWTTALGLAILDGFQMDFGPWYMDDFGTRPSTIGIATSLHFVLNALTYIIAPHIINLMGYMNVLTLGLFFNIFVFVLFSVAKSAWLVIVLYTMAGVVPALTWSCGVAYVAMTASPLGLVTTAEGIYGAIYNGIGVSFGTVMGGVVIKILGIRSAFQLLAGLSALNLITMNVLLYIDSKISQEEGSYEPVDTDEDR